MDRDIHPDLDTLAALAADRLDGDEMERVAGHVARCRRCRLEVRRLARFAAIDADEALAAEAGWERVEGRIVRPDHHVLDGRRRFSGLKRLVWLVPAAAAAGLLLTVLPPGDDALHDPASPPRVLRGDTADRDRIIPQEPTGDVAAPPDRFTWSGESGFDAYRLEISTPDLDVLLLRDELTDPVYVLSDSLSGLFTPGETYLWTVTGRRGVEAAAASETAWFRIVVAD